MNWHLTWQDPVALGLAVVCLTCAWLLARRHKKRHGCAGCASAGQPAEGAPPTVIPLERLRMERRR